MVKGAKMFWMFGCWMAKDLSTAQLVFSAMILALGVILCIIWFALWVNNEEIKDCVKYVIGFTFICGLGFYGVAIVLGFCSIRFVIRLVVYYKEFNGYSRIHNSVKISFKTFKNLYTVSKKRFKFTQEWIINSVFGQLFYVVDKDDFKEEYHILIPNVVEFVKFYFWYKNALKKCAKKKKIKQGIEESKIMEDILNQAQKDIDALRKRSEDEIKEATGMMKDVGERLRNE